MFFIAINLLTQLSQIGIEIGGFDSASGVSFHHKAYYLADGCISLARLFRQSILSLSSIIYAQLQADYGGASQASGHRLSVCERLSS
jgi:hypothetical protein